MKLTEEQRAFRSMLAALCRLVAMIIVFVGCGIYKFSSEAAFYLLCIALFLILLDSNYQHQLAMDNRDA